MSISGISSSNPVNNLSFPYSNSEFRQLGQDLTNGNLTAAQSDLSALQQMFAPGATSSSGSTDPVTTAFQQLSQDVQCGNLSAAKQDYATIQQDMQSHAHARHHLNTSGSPQNSLLQELSQLGQDISAGMLTNLNPSALQMAYGMPVAGTLTPTTSLAGGDGDSVSVLA